MESSAVLLTLMKPTSEWPEVLSGLALLPPATLPGSSSGEQHASRLRCARNTQFLCDDPTSPPALAFQFSQWLPSILQGQAGVAVLWSCTGRQPSPHPPHVRCCQCVLLPEHVLSCKLLPAYRQPQVQGSQAAWLKGTSKDCCR